MTTFSASDAALEGFRLTRERPGTVLAWSALYFLGVLLIGGVMLGLLGQDFVSFVQKGGLESGDPAALGNMLRHSWPAFLLVLLLVVFLGSVVTAGVYRLVLRPDEPGLAHLRIGSDEVRLTVVNLVLFSIGMVFVIVLAMVVAFVASGRGWFGALIGLFIAGATIWIGVRLLLASAMTFGERRIAIGASWKLTRGHFWSLLGMAVLAVVFYVMVWVLLSVIGGAFVALAGGKEAMAHPEHLRGLTVVAFLVTVFIQLLMPVLQILTINAPLAVAYRDLMAEEEEEAASGLPRQV